MPHKKVETVVITITYETQFTVYDLNLFNVDYQLCSKVTNRYDITSEATTSVKWINENERSGPTFSKEFKSLEIPNGRQFSSRIATTENSGYNPRSLQSENDRIRTRISLGRSSVAALENLNHQMAMDADQPLEQLIYGSGGIFVPRR